MSEEDRILDLLYRFENAGLVEQRIENLVLCLAKQVLGIGLGEQGFVTSVQDAIEVLKSGIKNDDTSRHSVDYKRVEVLRPADNFAVVCAQIQVNSHPCGMDKPVIRSEFQQSLTVILEDGEWKICGLHASTPVVTEEDIEAYPLKFAEKTLHSLKEKIGVEAYLAEEQYRKAVLADTIAFYIINFTRDCFEKCQLQNDLCAYVSENTPYQHFLIDATPKYVFDEDIELFLRRLSMDSIEEAFANGTNEVTCEYRMKNGQGGFIWMKTIMRLIKDIKTGDNKGIMYVKNIEDEKLAENRIKQQVDYDGMTKVLNKGATIRKVNKLLSDGSLPDCVFLMIDVDNFKTVNDNFGHPAGDQVLIEIAGILCKYFQSPSLVGRLGGDEFAVFAAGVFLDDTMKNKIESLLKSVGQLRIPSLPELQVSISVGAVCLKPETFDELYQAADTLLYQVKRAGKNGVIYTCQP